MAKGSLLGDTFEQLAELGASSVKTTAKQVGQTISPIKMAQTVLSSSNESNNSNKSNESNKSNLTELSRKGKDHTPLDFKKLQEKYQDKEKMKMESLRNRLFQIVKREDERSLERQKLSEAEKKRKEEHLVQEKKQKEKEKKQQEQPTGIPKGKVRRSIFSPKKTADRQHAEVKPSAGKQ